MEVVVGLAVVSVANIVDVVAVVVVELTLPVTVESVRVDGTVVVEEIIAAVD